MKSTNLTYYWWNRWTVIAFLIVIMASLPLFTLIFNVFEAPGNSWTYLRENLLFDYFVNTLLLLIGVALGTFVLGVSTAWVVSSYNFPGRSYFEWLLVLPLGFPGYIMAYTYSGLFDYAGPIQSFFINRLHLNIEGGLVDIMNLPGAIFIFSITLFPYVFIISRSSFLQQSKILHEASSLLESNRLKAFYKVALPMAWPAIVGGIAFASMEVLNDYGVVKYLGISTFTTGIFRAWFSLGDATTAIHLAGLLVPFVIGLLFLENFQRGNRRYVSSSFHNKPAERTNLSRGNQYILTSIGALIFIISFFIPLMQIIYWVSLTFHKVVDWDFFILVFRSFGLALSTGGAVLVLSVILLYALRLTPFKWLKNITRLATLGYAVPGAVIALSIMVPYLKLDKWLGGLNSNVGLSLFFSGTLFALTSAYIVRFMAVGYNSIDAGFHKIGIHVNEASRLLGNSTVKTLLKIDLPLIKSSLFTGILLVIVDVLKELPLTLFLRPFNYQTLATKSFELATNEMIAESATAALIIILTGIIPIIFLNRLIRTREDGTG